MTADDPGDAPLGTAIFWIDGQRYVARGHTLRRVFDAARAAETIPEAWDAVPRVLGEEQE